MVVLSRRAVIFKAPGHLDILKSHLYKTDFMNLGLDTSNGGDSYRTSVRALLNAFTFNNHNQTFL